MLHSRLDRVSGQIKEALAEIFDRELDNPEIPEFVTIHSVQVSKDLRVADIHVTFLGDDTPEAVKTAMKAINASAGYIRSILAGRIVLKYLPQLKFHYTSSTHYAADLEKLFHKPGFHAGGTGADGEEKDSE